VTVLESLLPVALKLLKDSIVDVRVALAYTAGELLTLLVGFRSMEEINTGNSNSTEDNELKRHKRYIDETLIPLLQNLLQDSNPEVTSSALRAVTNASRGNVREIRSRKRPVVGPNNEEDDSISVSERSLSSQQSNTKSEPVFIPVLSEEQVLRLVPNLTELASSSQWRVRQSAVEIVPALLGCTSRLETRAQIAQLCIKLMEDNVDAVRKTAAECLCLGGLNSGGDSHFNSRTDSVEWVQSIVLPHVEASRDSPDSKQRLLSLKMVEIIIVNGACQTDRKPIDHVVSQNILANHDEDGESASCTTVRRTLMVAASLAKDKIANVRLNVGRVFGSIIHTLDDEDLRYVVDIIEKQVYFESTKEGSQDRDVLYFAKQALSLGKDRMAERCGL